MQKICSSPIAALDGVLFKGMTIMSDGFGLSEDPARITLSALKELQRIGGRYALAFMSIGAGQGVGLVVERV